MKTKSKIIIGVFIVCVIYASLMLVLNGKNLKQVVMPTYLVVSDKAVFKLENDKWVDSNYSQISNVKFTIDNEKKGYVSMNMGKTYIKENGKYKQKNFRVAISNSKVGLADYEKSTVKPENDYYVSTILSNVDKSIWNTFDAKMVNIDLDGDNQSEMLYVVSDVTKDNTSCIGTKVFMVKDNEIQMIINSGMYRYELTDILDLNNDGKYEIILEKSDEVEDRSNCFELYELKNGKYKAIKKCEL